MTKISGKLIDGAGNALPNVQIVLTAIKTSNTVLNQTKALITTTSEAGKYDINVEIGSYAVTVLRDGFPIERVGTIEVLLNSKSGTLNDFLLLPKTGQTVTSDLLQQISDERKLAQTAATNAKKSADDIPNSYLSLKKGGTVTGQVVMDYASSGIKFNSENNNSCITRMFGDDFRVAYYDSETKNWSTKLSFNYSSNSFSFLNVNGVTVNGTDVITTSNISNYSLLKTGGTLTGPLCIKTDNHGFTFENSANYKWLLKLYSDNSYGISTWNSATNSWVFKLRYAESVKAWRFENIDDVTINGLSVLKTGDGGLFSKAPVLTAGTDLLTDDVLNVSRTVTLSGKYINSPDDTKVYTGTLEIIRRYFDAGSGVTLRLNQGGNVFYVATATKEKGTWVSYGWVKLITSSNSTVDSNGFLKAASPILRLYAEQPESADGFTQAGYGLVNSDAKGVCAKKIGIGHYEIHGSLGFAKEGWYIEQPKDANGNVFSFLEYSTDENNVITVKIYTKKFDYETCNIVAGELADIKEGRWIDLRLEMPIIETVEQIEPIPSLLNPII